MPPNPLLPFLNLQPLPDSRPDPSVNGVDAILDAVREHLGMEIAFAGRYVDGRREFTHIRTDLPIPHRPGDSEPQEESFCWHILHGRLPELIHNAADLPLALTLPVTKMLPVGAHMDVPLRRRDGTLLGSFCCVSRTPDYSLNQRDLATLRAFADLAAVQIEEELQAEDVKRQVQARVDEAIAAGLPHMQLQPIHRFAGARIVGMEALARFPDNKERPPSDWFAEAAAVGRGLDLELAAVRSAVQALAYVPAPAYLSINVAPATVLSGALLPILRRAPRGRLVLEVTEHAEVQDYGELRAALAPLRQYARIAIDDVGAGYSSLRHILDLEPDILKLDMVLNRDVDSDPARHALIGAMVTFAGRVGCTVVAEGVETPAEAAALQALGVDCGQGWHFGRPVPPVAAQQLLLAGEAETGAPRRKQTRRAA